MKFVVKTLLGMEYITASRLKDLGANVIEIRPSGFLGLLIVEGDESQLSIPEVESYVPILVECDANLDEIAKATEKIIEQLKDVKTFDVRAKVRGKHNFKSRDVSNLVSEKLMENYKLDWISPDVTVCVEIIGKKAYIGFIKGVFEHRKYLGKFDSTKIFSKTVIVQTPYLEKKAYEFGEAIGRAAQAFEVKELIIAPYGYVDAFELEEFIRGVRVGQKSRLNIQKKAYSREVRETKVLLQDLFQCVRDKRRKKNVIIVTDPAGEPVYNIKEELRKKISFCNEIVVLAGSRHGIPKGIFRFADFVVDLSPNITFATEHTIPSILCVLIEILNSESLTS